MGSSTYTTLSDLLAPETPGTKTYVEISTKLKDHFLPKRSTIAERFHFHKRDQAAGESVAEYDAALRKLAVNCKFGTNLQDTLRDRFVCGLRHEAIQRRLLSESTLTYATATETARAMEAAQRYPRAMEAADKDTRVISCLEHLLTSTKNELALQCNTDKYILTHKIILESPHGEHEVLT